MNDTSNLLGQLRIDREPQTQTPRRWPWVLAAVLLLAVAGISAMLLLAAPAAIPIGIATARTLGSGAGQASVLDASGYVIARRQATVSSKVTGKVIEVRVEEGQAVTEGEVLARIDDSNARAQLALAQSQLDAAKAQLTEVRVQLGEAQRQLQRTRELSARKLVSEQALDTAQANVDGLAARLQSTQANVTVADRSLEVQQRQLDDTVVRAPFTGVITIKNAQPGEMISPLSAGGAGTRTGIGTLVDMDSLEVEVDVNENFINRVQAGQPVTARLNAYPDWQIPSHVIAVIPTADRSKATVKVRIGFDVRDPRILPEMGIRVSFMNEPSPAGEGSTPKGVLVPADAVLDGVVFVVNGEQVERRAVRIAGTHADGVIVESGLRSGERIATGDLSRLSDGARVTIKQ
ncbi:efflux RND transporter periplasmic adaptor subunit [Sinimarinibacterium sp. CAU 1509]|uniref:efflux RND transporter periplasmic adaptor subunit n=1 Tax=Sinimarinibacterium sp. CAU 1509 TaxID=2562283 RepID=UPI0010AD9941|nr:efflux RND transporter periplasmic adaptor subunit [Sinimarinibacterium sp. CAU 1509]TJY65049.1 efflux RND transporter periplasmic adaptor subunit [Sinimarinibacterium sp. CAU 1509]